MLIPYPTAMAHASFTTFFASKQETEQVRSDIALLTYLLSQADHRDNDPRPSSRARPKRDSLAAIQPWIHLASMLTTGERHHPTRSNVAVTGMVENDAITVALITGRDSFRHHPAQLSVSELTPTMITGWELLQNVSSTVMCATVPMLQVFLH